MKIQIKNMFDLSVIFECEAENMRIAVELAVESEANLSGADLSRADLSGADLSGANLSGANLSGANLSRANLYGSNLYGSNLYGSNLSGANLSGANLYGSNLSGSNLSGSNLSGAYLSGANLSRADLSGANLYGEKITKIPIQISGLKWLINITEKHIQIGCQVHEAEKWFKFKDAEINKMHSEALAWWKENKKFIKSAWLHHIKD